MGNKKSNLKRIYEETVAFANANNDFQGKLNVYKCEKCGREMVTIDKDAGTTPFVTICDECGAEARSAMYMCDPNLVPEYEWYRPTLRYIIKNPMVMQHVLGGGLLLRKIVQANG